ncbi:MAG: DUF370 domain-containing protein [Oscillospiraceae bacterium]|nr:DUF370 domain-containing protein [Oscillospiraceae bacterium]
MQLLNIGFGNLLNTARVLGAFSPESQPVRRIIQEAKAGCTLIDATHGRKTKCVLMLDSGHVVISYLQPEILAARLGQEVTANGD